jgi:hypothetical protein
MACVVCAPPQPHRGGCPAWCAAARDFDRVAALETALYMRNQLLRDADWAGMSHGVEIRVPYVDPFFLAALPPGERAGSRQAPRTPVRRRTSCRRHCRPADPRARKDLAS